MRKFWDRLFDLNDRRSLWVTAEDLGTEKAITHRARQYLVKIPRTIQKKVVLRLRGLGKTRRGQTGDLLLSVWLNQGEDVHLKLWVSASSVQNHQEKRLWLEEKKVMMRLPATAKDGTTVRRKGLGKPMEFNWRAPLLDRQRGNLLVKLSVYPDVITPQYGSFDQLETEDMALEGWVDQKVDEIIGKIGKSALPARPLQAERVADEFNDYGWRGVFRLLVNHLKLKKINIELTDSATITMPGSCQKSVHLRDHVPVAYSYTITLHSQFLDNPFAVAAIAAHELGHVMYAEWFEKALPSGEQPLKSAQATLEEERTVDLLAFLFKMGEFQLRTARDQRLTIGYFNQRLFERMQVIVARKLG